MAVKRVNIDGEDYVPIAALSMLVTPESKAVAALVAASLMWARADDHLAWSDAGLDDLDRVASELKRAACAFERRCATRSKLRKAR